MARDHARLMTRIWQDPDWRSLTVDAQHAYVAILSQPGLSYAGVLDYLPKRLAGLSAGNTIRRVTTAVKALHDARFVVVDNDIQEVLIRSLVRHDGVLDRLNMGKATARAFAKSLSIPIRETILDELARAYVDDDQKAGWAGFAEIEPDGFEEVINRAARMASGM